MCRMTELRDESGQFESDVRDTMRTMTTKDKVLEAVKNLPDNAKIEDAMESLLVMAKIERGLAQADSGKLLQHEEVKQRLAKWLK